MLDKIEIKREGRKGRENYLFIYNDNEDKNKIYVYGGLGGINNFEILKSLSMREIFDFKL